MLVELGVDKHRLNALIEQNKPKELVLANEFDRLSREEQLAMAKRTGFSEGDLPRMRELLAEADGGFTRRTGKEAQAILDNANISKLILM